jgi:hypothetical protein
VPSVNLRPTLQPFAIPRCSSLQIPKNAPCSLSRENSLQHLGTITKFHRQRMGLSLHFVQISLQIANCRENGWRDRFASDCILRQAVGSLQGNFPLVDVKRRPAPNYASGGDVTVAIEPGMGSVFTVRLPSGATPLSNHRRSDLGGPHDKRHRRPVL